LAALVRKAKQENNGAVAIATKVEEEHQPPPVTTQIEYSSDREYDATSTSIIVKPKALFLTIM